MMDKIQLASLQQADFTKATRPAASSTPAPDQSFEDALQAQLGRPPAVRFSAHAQRRISSRNIEFGREETMRLEEAVEKAAGKGARESLILMDDLALVVSIKNKTVITAVDADSRKDNVFTNIDSVVLT
ncbi:MAG TPA: TIGR02530 family flagellar biosynthesis protein [Anaerolineae bacterium]|nr:TIGR02530 family flagellar biosynthesis protein [Anaerolineae bacterium]HMR64314.1 TIGR02530 family flagellar biosynthesis protein [Anaerolineae bacterium]